MSFRCEDTEALLSALAPARKAIVRPIMQLDVNDFRLLQNVAFEFLRRRLSRIPSLPMVQLFVKIDIVGNSVVIFWNEILWL